MSYSVFEINKTCEFMQKKSTVNDLPAVVPGCPVNGLKSLKKALITIMRVTFIQITVALIFSGVSIAFDNHAQEILKRKVSLELKDISLLQTLIEIEKAAKVKFVYSPARINLEERISLEVSNQKLGALLSELLHPRSIKFKVQDGDEYIILVENEKVSFSYTPADPVTEEVVVATISGRVRDAQRNPMPGVNIIQKGTSIGTTTDVSGLYKLEVIANDAILVFSFIGYTTQELPVNGRSAIDVTLLEDVQNLEEVVVVGYGVQRKSDITGSVGVATKKDLEQPTFNVLQRLRGKVAGVNIYTNSGAPMGNNRVVIRGMGTINASSNPLYVVDGVVMENIDVMNPNDIKSVEVLKDASATAIYGARGANGVILITTERGGTREGITIGYGMEFSASKMRKKMDVMNSEEFMEVQRIGFENAPKFNTYTPGMEPVINLSDSRLFDAQGKPIYDTDWQEETTRTALSQNHQLSVQSGGEKSSVGVFLNYTDRQGIVLNSWMKRANIKLVFDAKPKKWLSMGTNLTVNKSWENNIVESGGGYSFGRGVTEMPPIFPIRWPDGTWTNSTQSTGLSFEGFPNPVHKAL